MGVRKNRKGPKLTIRRASETHARAVHTLISANREEGRLLPRTLEEIRAHANRFTIVVRGRRIVGCGELAPLSPQVAEVRSLVVDATERGNGVGTMLVDNLRQRAHDEGFDKLSAFTHAPGYFSQMGFSIVPHVWLQEKIFTDCVNCASYRRCQQYAMVTPLDDLVDQSEQTVATIPLERLREGFVSQVRA